MGADDRTVATGGLEGVDAGEERRRHQRVPVRLDMHCRRLGRSGVDAEVEAVDLSPGGARFVCPTGLATGDVVLLTLRSGGVEVGLKGLVVTVSSAARGRRDAHVAFTSLSPGSAEGLGRVLEVHLDQGDDDEHR